MPTTAPAAQRTEPIDATRDALVRVALDRFGAKGFEATSTREIAKLAGANIAAIAYYFGGKEGLRTACAEYVATTLGRTLGPALAAPTDELSRDQAVGALARAFGAMIDFLVIRSEAEPIARFVLRELNEPSPTFDILHDSAMSPMHLAICRLWATATGGEADSEATRLATLSMIGQAIYFRVARRVVLKRMNWRDLGPAEAAKIKRTLLGHLGAAIELASRENT